LNFTTPQLCCGVVYSKTVTQLNSVDEKINWTAIYYTTKGFRDCFMDTTGLVRGIRSLFKIFMSFR
jgi:hypothetical protein